MTPSFHASHVSVDDMGDFLLIGLADQEYETQDYLMLQRAHDFDEQDRRLGMAEVYVERNGQGCSSYGGIARLELMRNKVRIQFDERGTRLMTGIREMKVSFEESNLGVLQSGLRQCFNGFSCYRENVI